MDLAAHAKQSTGEDVRYTMPGMNVAKIIEEEVSRAMNSSNNWRELALDRVQNSCYKNYTSPVCMVGWYIV